MSNVNLYTLQMQSRLFAALDVSMTTKKRDSNQGTVQAGALDFSSLLNACLASSGTSTVPLVSASSSAVGAAASTSAAPSNAGNMQISANGVQFIANHEGYAANAYRGADTQNQTIGYGHVLMPGESYANLTQPQALSLLKSDLSTYENAVNHTFAGTKLTQNQFDALVSFSYNLGANIWSKAPQLTSDIKNGASPDVLRADFERISYCNGRQLQGLVTRRLDEFHLFEEQNA
ncbi:lysozyme [Ethanoligenens sp.]|uniref:lysozyme n=1 Tax=Ethanoligenens sp. TaxID=2099655 RepID=UPI0039E8280C